MQIRFASRSACSALAAALAFSCGRSGASWKLFAAWRPGELFELQPLAGGAGRGEGGDTTPLGSEFGGGFKVRGFGLSAGDRRFSAPAVAVGLDYDLTRCNALDTHGALHTLGVAAQYSF